MDSPIKLSVAMSIADSKSSWLLGELALSDASSQVHPRFWQVTSQLSPCFPTTVVPPTSRQLRRPKSPNEDMHVRLQPFECTSTLSFVLMRFERTLRTLLMPCRPEVESYINDESKCKWQTSPRTRQTRVATVRLARSDLAKITTILTYNCASLH